MCCRWNRICWKAIISKWMEQLQFALFNQPVKVQQWNYLAHVEKHFTFLCSMWLFTSGHCSAVTILNLKWRLNSKKRSVGSGFMSQNLWLHFSADSAQHLGEWPPDEPITRWYEDVLNKDNVCKCKSPGRPSASEYRVDRIREPLVWSPYKSTGRVSTEIAMMYLDVLGFWLQMKDLPPAGCRNTPLSFGREGISG